MTDTSHPKAGPIVAKLRESLHADVDLGPARLELRGMVIPKGESQCELVAGDTPQAQAERLALRLRELKVI